MRNKQDKIFDNNFEAPDLENRGSINFDLDSSVRGNLSEEENIHYEILGTGKCTIFFKNDVDKKVEIEGRGNYGLKPTEQRIKDAIGDILLTSDSNVTKYNVVIEAQKESGYTS